MTAETALVLRTCQPDGTSHGGFRWPTQGRVEAPDWSPVPECGEGLHGLLWGCGTAEYLTLNGEPGDLRWQVVEVAADTVVDLDGKVKFPCGSVVYSGDQAGAVAYLDAHGAADKPVVYAQRTVGDVGMATAGDCGTATAGYGGTATAGNDGTATADDEGMATAGDYGTATAGDNGTAAAGYNGTATAGYEGTATAGDYGIIMVRHRDGNHGRWRIVVGYIGEDGLLPGVPYQLDGNGQLVVAERPADGAT